MHIEMEYIKKNSLSCNFFEFDIEKVNAKLPIYDPWRPSMTDASNVMDVHLMIKPT